jgi:hypothetical protein
MQVQVLAHQEDRLPELKVSSLRLPCMIKSNAAKKLGSGTISSRAGPISAYQAAGQTAPQTALTLFTRTVSREAATMPSGSHRVEERRGALQHSFHEM